MMRGVGQGGKVLTTTLEHNSVLRPLFTLEKKGVITLEVITPENKKFITLEDIKKIGEQEKLQKFNTLNLE